MPTMWLIEVQYNIQRGKQLVEINLRKVHNKFER